MTLTSKVFRVFVSSTFSDLKAERGALQRHVWPALVALCRQHGARFQAIDLRWGVGEEASLDQQTIPICLSEIARCQLVSPRPNFIVLLGDRYGWRPLPAVIPRSEMDAIVARLTDAERARLLWSDGQPADEHGWYRRDDNAVPPEYVLLPRQRDGPYADAIEWDTVERELLAILERATGSMRLSPDDRLKYGASATEQEVEAGALRVSDASRHVHCFFRTIDGLPEPLRQLPGHKLAEDFRDYADEDPLEESGGYGQAPRNRLEKLKNTLRDRLGEAVHDYRARWLGPETHTLLSPGTPSPISLEHLDQFCLDVFDSLARTILQEVREQQQIDPQLAEERAHDDFRRQRAAVFVGRREVLALVASYLTAKNRCPLLLHGVSGSGKSAVMAKAATAAWALHGGPAYDPRSLLQSGIASSGARFVTRFIGTTPDSSDGRALLNSICRQLARDYDGDQTSVPADFTALVADFGERLGQADAKRPLLLFLDALDQLSDANNARALSWLPTELPDHVHIVVSAISDPHNPANDCYRAIERRLRAESRVPIDPLPPEEASELLATWLMVAGRTLDGGRPLAQMPDGQRAQVRRDRSGSGLPLYLQLAFEAARRWQSFTPKEDTILAEDVPGLLRDLFGNLAHDGRHGPVLIEYGLGLLAAAKNGLTEDELLDLLSPIADQAPQINAFIDTEWRSYITSRADWIVLADFHRRSPLSPRVSRLPVVLWSRLAFDLRPYLAERSGDDATLMNFYHRQLRDVIEADFLRGQAGLDRHRQIAEYFCRQPLEIGPDGLPGLEPAGASELGTPVRPGTLFESSAADRRDAALRERAVALSTATGLAAATGTQGRMNLRKLSEQPYQQTLGEQWDEVTATLTDFSFIERKAATGRQSRIDGQGAETVTFTGIFDLQADYERALMHLQGVTEGGMAVGVGTGAPIITAVKFPDQDAPGFRCPKCLQFIPLRDEWLGTVLTCPRKTCGCRLKLNPYLAGRPLDSGDF